MMQKNTGYLFMLIATIISMTIITASQLFTDKISRLLDLQASELLAADAVVLSNTKINPEFLSIAESYQLSVAQTVTLRSAIFVEDELKLVELKAVDDHYPLRGHLEIKQSEVDEAVIQNKGPERGELWIDQQIASYIHQPQIEIGELVLKPNKILSLEPDRGGSLFNLAPRVMIHLDDLDATGLVLPGSRMKYYFLFSGPKTQIESFIDEITPQLSNEESLQSLQNARPEMRRALDRVRNFFALGIMMTLVISMSAVALSARYVATQESKKVSVMRAFGVPKFKLLNYYLKQIFIVWLLALPIGWGLGWLSQVPIEWLLGHWFNHALPSSSFVPYLMGALMAAIGLFGFSMPFISLLLKTSPNHILRAQNWGFKPRQLSVFLMVLVVLAVLLLVLIQDWKLTLSSLLGIIAVSFFVPLCIGLLIKLLTALNPKHFWQKRFVLTRLLSPKRNGLFVMTAFMMTLLAVLLVGVVKDDLFSDWQGMLKQDTPNYFAINIQPNETQALNTVLKSENLTASNLYPLVNARFLAINGTNIEDIQFTAKRAEHFKQHIFKISASADLPLENEIIDGEWPPALGTVSVEESMAKNLNLKVNDELIFDVAGEQIKAKISSIRYVVWENFKPNFYVLSNLDALQHLPHTYIMSVYIPADKKALLQRLHQDFSSITWLDITQLMARIKNLIDRSALALEFFFAFAVIAGLVVLLSSVAVSQQQRINEIALLKTLGLSQKGIIKVQLLEFFSMGFFIGLFACTLASMVGWLVSTLLFDMTYFFNMWLWLVGMLSSICLLTVSGFFAVKNTLKISPVQLLRSS